MVGGSGPLPQPVSAITVINGDQNTQVTEKPDHLSGGESSVAPTVNTGPSYVRVGGSVACIWMCVCASACAWEASKALMASHVVSSDNVTVDSPVFQLCPVPTDTCVKQTCR